MSTPARATPTTASHSVLPEGEGSASSGKRVDKKTLHKAIAASAMGNATEWYDYGVYAVVATQIGDAFFPGDLSSVLTMLGLAVSFVLRPVGGLVWGPLGDKLGRRAVLAITILLMAAATTLIGVLPTHATIGVAAPILLILLRVVQGFSTGGEYGGAATFMAEYAPDKHRGRYGSFLEFGSLGGFVLGSAVVLGLQHVLSTDDMSSWGWRLPFFLAAPLGLIGWYLRDQLDETPVFEDAANEGHAHDQATKGLRHLLVVHWPQLLTMGGMVIALNVANYTLLTYQPTYLGTRLGVSESQSTTVMLVGEFAMMAVIPFCGALSDKVGRKPLWWFSLIGLFVFAVPMYMLMAKGFGWAIVAFVVLGLLYIPQLATISATFPAMFPTVVRYAGFAISYNVATAAFGGTAPAVNDAVIHHTGWDLFPAFYMMGACVIGMISTYFLVETAGESLRGTTIPGTDVESVPA